MLERQLQRAPIYQLSPRERGVLRLVAEGHTTREIGVLLFLSPETIKRHRKTILWKLEARTSPQAVAIALKHGLIS